MDSTLRYSALTTPSDRMPDRLNELWRFGRPHQHASAVAKILATQQSSGRVSCDADTACQLPLDEASRPSQIRTAGSHALVTEQLKHYGQGVRLRLTASPQSSVRISYETEGFFAPYTEITLEAGVAAHIIEEHRCLGEALIFALRRVTLHAGAMLRLELREQGSGVSRCFNITEIDLHDALFYHYSTHEAHRWGREETSVDLHRSSSKGPRCDAFLYSANLLEGSQMLDQRTDQNHFSPDTESKLLYKNVMDGKATAVFNGNILVAPSAHGSEAYQTNRNLMLSEQAVVHSQPGLEILADKVKCSHGAATGPINEEQLFYMQSRGITGDVAHRLVAEGFLSEVYEQFAPSHSELGESS